jgi:hypothetical protein
MAKSAHAFLSSKDLYRLNLLNTHRVSSLVWATTVDALQNAGCTLIGSVPLSTPATKQKLSRTITLDVTVSLELETASDLPI